MFLFFTVNARSELVQNPENNSIFSLPREFSKIIRSNSENWYTANRNLLGFVLVIRTANYPLHSLPCLLPITITFISYQHYQKTAHAPVIFQYIHPFPQQFLSVSLCLPSFWCLSLEATFSRIYYFI